MKKVLLFSILLLTTLSCVAYETIIFHFPDGELWESAFYKKRGNEAILQYVPGGQTSNNWIRTIVVHSYQESDLSAPYFAQKEMLKMRKINPTGKYTTIKSKENDFAQDMYEDMLFEEYATQMTKTAGFGLADQIYLSLA